jgi:hypothetical protein
MFNPFIRHDNLLFSGFTFMRAQLNSLSIALDFRVDFCGS